MIHDQERFNPLLGGDDEKTEMNWQNWQSMWRQHPSFAVWGWNTVDPTQGATTTARTLNATVNSALSPTYLDQITNWDDQDDGITIIKEVPWTWLKFEMRLSYQVTPAGAYPANPIRGVYGLQLSPAYGSDVYIKCGDVTAWPPGIGGDMTIQHTSAVVISKGPVRKSTAKSWPAAKIKINAYMQQVATSCDYKVYDLQYTVQEIPPTDTARRGL